MKDGWTSRASFDKAQHNLETLQANVDAAQAQLRTAREQLGFTKLAADGPGLVTKVGAQPGEVVSPGRMVCESRVTAGATPCSTCPDR